MHPKPNVLSLIRRLSRRPLAGAVSTAALLALCYSGPSVAQRQLATPPAPPSTTQIIMLGTAGGPPLRPDRSQPAVLLTVRGQNYLFDCGTGTVRQLARAGIPIETVRTLFVTHHHPDHDLDLATFIGNAKFTLGWSATPLTWNIYGPVGTTRMVKAATDFIAVPFDIFAAADLSTPASADAGSPPFVAHEIADAGQVYRDANIEVTAVINSHYQLMKAADRAASESFSFRIKTPDGTIVITGDTGTSSDVTRLSSGADVLITEAMDLPAMYRVLDSQSALKPEQIAVRKQHMKDAHIDLPDIGRMASEAGVGTVILTHLGPETARQAPSDLSAKVSATYKGRVITAADFDRYCLVPSAKSGHSDLSAC